MWANWSAELFSERLKKFRNYLYGVYFLVEIDAKTLIYQLNQPVNDIPGAVVARWLAYIRLFSFDIVHVSGTQHRGPDSLSRRPATTEEEQELKENGRTQENELEEAIEDALGRLRMEENAMDNEVKGRGNENCQLIDVKMVNESGKEEDEEAERIVRWLLTLERPKGLGDGEFARFKREETK